MNFALVVILGTALNTVGTFDSDSACQAASKQFQSQGVKAVCVQQPSPDQQLAQAQKMMSGFMSFAQSQMKSFEAQQ